MLGWWETLTTPFVILANNFYLNVLNEHFFFLPVSFFSTSPEILFHFWRAVFWLFLLAKN